MVAGKTQNNISKLQLNMDGIQEIEIFCDSHNIKCQMKLLHYNVTINYQMESRFSREDPNLLNPSISVHSQPSSQRPGSADLVFLTTPEPVPSTTADPELSTSPYQKPPMSGDPVPPKVADSEYGQPGT
ncbi:hypothetical protein JTB14_001884 [Gonioctena quinquepunctata]|nr:hypothetical protein JTB14_001884 [Gonioctena quinquepunctata]